MSVERRCEMQCWRYVSYIQTVKNKNAASTLFILLALELGSTIGDVDVELQKPQRAKNSVSTSHIQ
jgi:hypothetical protein